MKNKIKKSWNRPHAKSISIKHTSKVSGSVDNWPGHGGGQGWKPS